MRVGVTVLIWFDPPPGARELGVFRETPMLEMKYRQDGFPDLTGRNPRSVARDHALRDAVTAFFDGQKERVTTSLASDLSPVLPGWSIRQVEIQVSDEPVMLAGHQVSEWPDNWATRDFKRLKVVITPS